jgi:hypothetical protein
MARRIKVMCKAIVVAASISLVASGAAHAQSKKGSHAPPSTESKPRVDEKAYKAALDRIPTPKKPYDPWSQVHEPEPAAKPAGKSN